MSALHSHSETDLFTSEAPPSNENQQLTTGSKDKERSGLTRRERMEEFATQFALNVNNPDAASQALATAAYTEILNALKPFIQNRAWRLAATTADAATTCKDLISVASISVYTNLKRWHPIQNRRFSMTAMRTHLNSEMVRCLNEEIRMIYYPEQLVQNIIALNKAASQGEDEAEKFLADVGSTWSARRLNAVKHHRHALLPNTASETLEEEHQDESTNGLRQGYRIMGEEPQEGMQDEGALLDQVMEGLAEHEKRTLRMYFGMGEFGEPHTYAKIGEIENITREGARQRVLIAMGKLRKKLQRMGISSYSDLMPA